MMAETQSNRSLLVAIIVLLVLNLAMTTLVFLRQGAAVHHRVASDISPAVADEWGGKVVDLYNRQEAQGLYALFNAQARVKVSESQLTTQLKNLKELFGTIDEYALASQSKLGEQGSSEFHQLQYRVRVSRQDVKGATLTLSIVRDNGKITLYGVKLNASQNLD